jgi:RNA polymerase sigma factor (sigma-70 family)
MVALTARDQVLANHHRKFLEFLRPRVENDAVAEDILQEAYAKSISRGGEIRDDHSVVAWFYQILRNAVVDHYRRSGTERNAQARLEREGEASFEPELRNNVCTCVSALLPDLKPEYADIVRAVELDERPIADVALEKGLTASQGRPSAPGRRGMRRVQRARLRGLHLPSAQNASAVQPVKPDFTASAIDMSCRRGNSQR